MKAKVKRGAGFRGVLNYSMEKEGAEIVGGNMVGQSPRELSSEFGRVRQLRPDIKKPVLHVPLSLPPRDTLSKENWDAVGEAFLKKMGLDPNNRPWVLVRHHDKDHEHAHLITSRVGLDGTVWHGKFEALHAIQATQELEQEFGLTVTPGLDNNPVGPATRVSQPEREMWERKGQQPPKERIAEAIEASLTKARDLEAFKAEMEAQGVQVKVNQSTTTGKISGLSFGLDGHAYKASQIHRKYSWANLSKQLERTTNEPHPGHNRRIPPACRRDRLHHLSELDVVRHTRRGEMLLQANVSNRLGHVPTQRDPALRWGNSVAPVDPHKQAYKARLLERHYQNEVRDSLRMTLNSIQFPGAPGDPVKIRLVGGGQLVDHGDRLTCGRGQEAEIAAMVELARVKGWQRVTLTGSPEFQRKAAAAYSAAGIQVVDPSGKALPVTTKEQQIHNALERLAANKYRLDQAQERMKQQSHDDERSKEWKSRPQH